MKRSAIVSSIKPQRVLWSDCFVKASLSIPPEVRDENANISENSKPITAWVAILAGFSTVVGALYQWCQAVFLDGRFKSIREQSWRVNQNPMNQRDSDPIKTDSSEHGNSYISRIIHHV